MSTHKALQTAAPVAHPAAALGAHLAVAAHAAVHHFTAPTAAEIAQFDQLIHKLI